MIFCEWDRNQGIGEVTGLRINGHRALRSTCQLPAHSKQLLSASDPKRAPITYVTASSISRNGRSEVG